MPLGPVPGIPARFGVVICFEVIFPNLVREFVRDGADFMVTITNDAWFGNSAAPYQHFGMVVLRAVENHVAFRPSRQHRHLRIYRSLRTHSERVADFYRTSHDRAHSRPQHADILQPPW